MKISIGILAHNEAERIERTLRCVLDQTLLRTPPAQTVWLELIIVPNGCSDQTASVAEALLREHRANLNGRIRTSLRSLAQPGKSNAWNRFVHEFADPDADFVMLLDADIGFNHTGCLQAILDRLIASPQAHCCVGRPLKDLALKGRRSLLDLASLAVSEAGAEGPPTIAGSMYVLRGPVARRIWMPTGLLVEDGFLRAMLTTDFFTAPGNHDRIVREPTASQVFESVRAPLRIFRHSKRLMVGTRINAFLYDKLWNLPKGEDAGSFSRTCEERDPRWLENLVREGVAGKGWWVMQRGLLLKRFRALRHRPLRKAILWLPVALAALPYDAAVLLAANRAVRRGEFRW